MASLETLSDSPRQSAIPGGSVEAGESLLHSKPLPAARRPAKPNAPRPRREAGRKERRSGPWMRRREDSPMKKRSEEASHAQFQGAPERGPATPGFAASAAQQLLARQNRRRNQKRCRPETRQSHGLDVSKQKAESARRVPPRLAMLKSGKSNGTTEAAGTTARVTPDVPLSALGTQRSFAPLRIKRPTNENRKHSERPMLNC